jgi:hypothetical protein
LKSVVDLFDLFDLMTIWRNIFIFLSSFHKLKGFRI